MKMKSVQRVTFSAKFSVKKNLSTIQAQLVRALQVNQTIVMMRISVNMLYSASIYHWLLSEMTSNTDSIKENAEM